MSSDISIAALADLHLVQGPRNADRLAALDCVVARETERPTDLWIVAGDVSDAGLTIDLRNALVERVRRMAAVAPVLVVPGNHDPEGDLRFLMRLAARYPICVAEAPDVLDVATRSDGLPLAVFCLPYPSKAAFVATGTPHDEIGAAVTAAFDVLFMYAAGKLDAARRDGRLCGFVYHGTVDGAVASTGQPQVGAELAIAPSQVARLGRCFRVAGHIHKHQTVAHAVTYCGSLCRNDWAETEPKGYLRVRPVRAFTIGDGAPPPGPMGPGDALPFNDVVWVDEFMPVPIPEMWHVEARLTRDGFEDVAVRKGPGGPRDEAPASWDGVDVRLRATYNAREAVVLAGAAARAKQLFPGARTVKFEPVAEAAREVRAPEVAQATTLPEKLAAWARVAGVAWTAEIAGCADRLLATEDGDAVVAEVERRLARTDELQVQEAVR